MEWRNLNALQLMSQYDQIASRYHKYMLDHAGTAEEDFIHLLGLDRKPISIFEYGCGSGRDAAYLLSQHELISKYVGIDNSEGMLHEFRSNVTDGRATVELADLDEYSFGSATYDLIFGRFSIHYTRDIAKLMQKTHSAINPGGFFAFRDVHPLVGLFRKKSKLYHVKEDVDFPLAGGKSDMFVTHPTFTFEEYINSASAAGFRILRVIERLGTQSKELGVDGYEIPTTVSFFLQRD
ncbi:MAG: class I SAM-dependent methyltransferase [Candidatus Dojkabacteria bacterium]|nr:MAG: class I SAM-dependent methyltransferase [Candidatus Dojkabacteria bacterium]